MWLVIQLTAFLYSGIIIHITTNTYKLGKLLEPFNLNTTIIVVSIERVTLGCLILGRYRLHSNLSTQITRKKLFLFSTARYLKLMYPTGIIITPHLR
jgi:hypothetical protein